MKLYLLTQDVNDDYDTFDSVVVAADSEEEARQITPAYGGKWEERVYSRTWATTPEQVKVKYLGDAADDVPSGIILASFNAG